MRNPIDDTRWASCYGSTAAVQAAFDRFGPEYHEAIVAAGVPVGVAATLWPYLQPRAQGIDFGCGSGVLGSALRVLGLEQPLDGLDLSPVMLDLARATGCYRHLHRTNLLLPDQCPPLPAPYDFAVTVGLIGDYVPYYLALPHIVSLLKPRAILGFAVEEASTPGLALERGLTELGLTVLAQTTLEVPEAKLVAQTYQFFVTRLEERSDSTSVILSEVEGAPPPGAARGRVTPSHDEETGAPSAAPRMTDDCPRKSVSLREDRA